MFKKSIIGIALIITVFSGIQSSTYTAHAFVSADPYDAYTVAAAAGDKTIATPDELANRPTNSVNVPSIITSIALDAVSSVLAFISTIVLHIMAIWIALTGALLNVSIVMTLHIKDFVDSTQGVYLVWQTIRDISGIFIIFMLLYASFKIILGFDTVGSVGTLIKNIVIVGVLINFSFFITSLLIDASNVVSLALYNGIVNQTSGSTSPTPTGCPAGTSAQTNDYSTCAIVAQMYTGTEGGLSALFMNALNPQLIYSGTGVSDSFGSANSSSVISTNPSTDVGSPFKIIIQSIIGIIIMFTSGLSFMLASFAFMVRLIVLVILLAFSPIWFASWVIPGLDEEAKKFTKHLKSQLVFMPVYLLLLYAALRILSSTSVFNNPSSAVLTGSGANLTFIPVNYIILAINDFFIIFLLNMPLVVGLSMGGLATDWIDTKKYSAATKWKNIGASLGRNTGGRLAHIASNSERLRGITAKYPLIGNLTSKQLDKAANFGFGQKKGGFKDVQGAKQKEYEEMYKKLSTPDASRYDDTIKDSDGKTALMRAKEKAKLDAERYYENTQETIMSRVMKGAASKLSVNAQKNGETQSPAAEFLNNAAAKNEAASRVVGINMSGRKAAATMKKQQDKQQKIDDAKEAKDAQAVAEKMYVTLEKTDNAELEKLTEAVNNLNETIETQTKEVTKHKEEIASIDRTNNLTMGNKVSTATQTASLAAAQTILDQLKAGKVAQEKQKSDLIAKMRKDKEEYQKQKDGREQKIKAAKEQEEAERWNKLDEDLKAATKKEDASPSNDKPKTP